MESIKLPVILAIQLGFLVVTTVQQDGMCGTPAPDPAKTCISIRLPWNPQPMYFCEDKTKFRFRNQCQNRFAAHCGINTIRADTLMVASPWDCCPLVSYPDSCVNQQCPPPPHERKCQVIEPTVNQPWECCNNYFCEENMTPEMCHFKRLEPTCNMPPQGKTNCVAFVDPFGCCPKFQCDGDTRPGQCPAELEAEKYMARFNATNMMMLGRPHFGPFGPAGPGFPQVGAGAVAGGAGAGAVAGAQAEMLQDAKPADGEAPPLPEAPPATKGFAGGPVASYVAGGAPNQIQCVGDFNCPGNMKCCSGDLNVYVKDGAYFFRNRNPTYGYCVEAAPSNAVTTTKRNANQKYTAPITADLV